MKKYIFIVLVFCTMPILAQGKTIIVTYTNRADFSINELYIYPKHDKKGINYLQGKVLKPNEEIEVSIYVRKKRYCHRTILISDGADNTLKFDGFNPCKEENPGLTRIQGVTMLLFEN